MEKWKQKAIQINLRKAVIFFLVTSFVFIIVSSAAVYGNFQNRMNEWEKFTETDREHDEGEKVLKKPVFVCGRSCTHSRLRYNRNGVRCLVLDACGTCGSLFVCRAEWNLSELWAGSRSVICLLQQLW